MPEVKNYEGKKKSHGHHDKHKRRPHHEAQQAVDLDTEIDAEMDKVEEMSKSKATATQGTAGSASADEINTEAQNEGVAAPAGNSMSEEYLAQKDMISEGAPVDSQSNDKTHLEFYGSEVIRQKAPKVMELADTVADEWKKDGQFEGLPVGNPLAQVAAAKVLRKAKDVEKKLEEKGVFAMAKMGIDYAKAEIEKRKKH
jgi:hypothetical protein